MTADGVSAADDRAPIDEYIDADLMCAVALYDPKEKYPEWPNSSMREAWRAGYDDAVAEVRRLRDRITEIEAVRDGEVLVEGSWIPRCELSTILGNFMRSSDERAREVKALSIERDRLRDTIQDVTALCNLAEQTHSTVRIANVRAALAARVVAAPDGDDR